MRACRQRVCVPTSEQPRLLRSLGTSYRVQGRECVGQRARDLPKFVLPCNVRSAYYTSPAWHAQ